MDKRLFSLYEGMAYTGLKRTKFREWAEEIGALVKIGKRALYDRGTIDRALDALAGNAAEGGRTDGSRTKD